MRLELEFIRSMYKSIIIRFYGVSLTYLRGGGEAGRGNNLYMKISWSASCSGFSDKIELKPFNNINIHYNNHYNNHS